MDPKYTKRVLIGANDRDEPGVYKWAETDEQITGYTNFELINDNLANCIYKDQDGKWKNTRCYSSMACACLIR